MASLQPMRHPNTNPPDTALKHDGGKPQVGLLVGPGGIEVARALTYGANKYLDRFNYRRGGGLAHSRLTDATLRHVAAHLGGETYDQESGLYHLAHAGASVNMLLDLLCLGLGNDDRWATALPPITAKL